MMHTDKGYMPKAGYLTQQMYIIAPTLMETVTTIDYTPLLDSSKMGHEDWITIAKDIEKNYDEFDSFVIIHGTDTMAYTASGLSFMLENLGKTVIITGSQIPLCELRNDASTNLIGALTLATQYRIPEVCIFFNNTLYRGCRSRKVNSSKLTAFDSPNHLPLAELDVGVVIHWDRIWRSPTKKLKVHTSLCAEILVLQLYPGIPVSIVRAMLSATNLKGVVLKSYGAGNVDTSNLDLIKALEEAHSRGIVIINLTQCDKGTVTAIYETGIALLEIGVLPGFDMTTEAALAKLSVLLGDPSLAPDRLRVQVMMEKCLRGELSVPGIKMDLHDQSFLSAVAKTLRLTDEEGREQLSVSLSPVIACAYASINDIEGLATVEVNCCDYDKRSPLHVAAAMGHVEAARYLLSRGADPSFLDIRGYSPLLEAVESGHYVIAKDLYDAGARLKSSGIKLCECAYSNNKEMLLYFLRFGMDPRVGDYDGRTCLHIAGAEGHTEMYAMILSTNPECAHVRDRWGNTPGVAIDAVDIGISIGEGEGLKLGPGSGLWSGASEQVAQGAHPHPYPHSVHISPTRSALPRANMGVTEPLLTLATEELLISPTEGPITPPVPPLSLSLGKK